MEEKHEGYPGHPEVELALLRMYHATGDKTCLALAEHFIDVRGVDGHFFEKETEKRNWRVWDASNPSDTDYNQSGKPVREQTDATGHSVRAVYLYTAMADLASETEDEALKQACRRLWDSITGRRMYITGGIGSTVQGEAFTVDYNLPNDTVYAETCASIGLMFFASRMLEMDADSCYADVLERALYNTVLAGMQLDGKRFFYVNPLEVVPGVSGVAVTHRHDLPQRPGWYACACCPPNVARTIGSLGRYAYGENAQTAYVHLFIEGKVSFENSLTLECVTGYPYEFQVSYQVLEGEGELAIRKPDWSRKFQILLNGKEEAGKVQKGYIYLKKVKKGDQIEILLDERAFTVYASPKVASNTGCAAIQRGPLVYCVEGVDNEGEVLSLSWKEDGNITVCPYEARELSGTVKLKAEGYRTEISQELYINKRPDIYPVTITAIPYYTWGNRGLNQMRVWLPERR